MFVQLQEFARINGHVEVPVKFVTAAGGCLRAWLLHQKRVCRAGRLSVERETRLRELGVRFDVVRSGGES